MKKIALPIIWLLIYCSTLPLCSYALSPEDIVKKIDEKFSRIKDAQADIVLDTSLQIMGCGGIQRQNGKLWFKAPEKIKVQLDKTTYFIKGNSIKKIDEKGKRFYVQLLHAPDFSPGFGPKLITHNFNLKVISDVGKEVILEGIPKPGVLKNVKKVTFYIDRESFLLKKMDFSLKQNMSGFAQIKYQNLKGIETPIATSGKSALEIFDGRLIGLYFALSGKNILVNSNLSDRIFEPGF